MDYDLLTWEGDILRLKFWAQAFDVLKAKGAVYLQNGGAPGRLLGDADPGGSRVNSQRPTPNSQTANRSQNRQPPSDRGEDEDEEREKVIVRSNGVVTYVGKDIAYQFWKLGLLGRDFHYRVFAAAAAGSALGDRARRRREASTRMFGGAAYVYNVIDVRQSYLQKLLKQALIAVGHPEGAERSHHFSYEMVALSHATARELGYAPPPIRRTPSVRSSRCRAARGSA